MPTNMKMQPGTSRNATSPAAVSEKTAVIRTRGAFPCVLLAVTALGGCNDRAANSVKQPTLVRTETVQLQGRPSSATLTGEVQARFSAVLSFRVSGRVIARLAGVGAHVNAGDVLARIDPTEQQADVDAATAGVAAAESQVRVAAATFERQKTLISKGYA